jgi:hypothetical protein
MKKTASVLASTVVSATLIAFSISLFGPGRRLAPPVLIENLIVQTSRDFRGTGF